LDLNETFVELLFHLCRIDHSLGNLGLVERVLDALLNIGSEPSLDEIRDFLSEDTVSISDGEEMCSSIFTQMWQNEV